MAEEVSHGDTPTKRCTKCGEVKPIGEFSNSSSRGKVVKNSRCKSCKNAYERAWTDANKERLNAKARERRRGRPVSESQKVWRKNNPEKLKSAYKKASRRRKDLLTDSHIANVMGLHVGDLTPELIELKRQQLQVVRAVKQLKEKANGK